MWPPRILLSAAVTVEQLLSAVEQLLLQSSILLSAAVTVDY
jgi:hypothetical protein